MLTVFIVQVFLSLVEEYSFVDHKIILLCFLFQRILSISISLYIHIIHYQFLQYTFYYQFPGKGQRLQYLVEKKKKIAFPLTAVHCYLCR